MNIHSSFFFLGGGICTNIHTLGNEYSLAGVLACSEWYGCRLWGYVSLCVKKVMFDYFQAQHKNNVLNK